MTQMNRRRFGAALLASAPALASASAFAQKKSAAAKDPATPALLSQTDFTKWPEGYAPQVLGKAVAEHFVPSKHHRPDYIEYPEVCTWYGALELARLTNDSDLLAKLKARFEPLFGAEASMLPRRGEHVDLSMFGALPLELYMLTKEKRYLDLGLSYADAQWAKPDAQGLTAETRFWIDDMYMITIVQLQAYRATGDKKYLDRAALEMAAYLDKLQQPNGLFFHAPDVPYFWSRGNGWFAVGMADVLRELPANHPKRERIWRGYRTMMQSLLRYQTQSGAWRQMLDHEEFWMESSGTAMFAYALITGVRNGWLDRNVYGAAAHRAWIAAAGFVDQNYDVTSVCEGTGKLNDLEYYFLRKRRTGDFHGQAPLLWTAVALLRPA